MFRGDLIIDGYNVLYAADLAPSHAGGELEQARGSLLRLISNRLTPEERNRTTVVFDAPVQFLGPSPPQEWHGLLVMFADRDGDADAAIERLILENSAPRRMCVVSSDHRLQKAARRRRGKFLDSDSFLRQLARRSLRKPRQSEQEPPVKHSGKLPPAEVEAWLRVFEDRIDEDVEGVAVPFRPAPPQQDKATGVNSNGQRSQPRPKPAPKTYARPKRKRPVGRPPPDAEESDPIEEISFWESRIAQLDEEELK